MSYGITVSRIVRVTVAGLVLTLASQVTLAHDNIEGKWLTMSRNGYDHWVAWDFDGSFPVDANMRGYVSNGRWEWNDVGRELWFTWSNSGGNPPIDVRYNDLWFPFDGKLAIALRQKCYHRQDICSGEITFNKTISGGWKHWYGQGTLNCEQKYGPLVDSSARVRSHGCVGALESVG